MVAGMEQALRYTTGTGEHRDRLGIGRGDDGEKGGEDRRVVLAGQAAEMAGVAERLRDRLETGRPIQPLRSVHVAERFEIAAPKAEPARLFETACDQLAAGAADQPHEVVHRHRNVVWVAAEEVLGTSGRSLGVLVGVHAKGLGSSLRNPHLPKLPTVVGPIGQRDLASTHRSYAPPTWVACRGMSHGTQAAEFHRFPGLAILVYQKIGRERRNT